MGFNPSDFELALRQEHPGCWVLLENITEGRRRDLIAGTVVAVAENLADLGRAVGDGFLTTSSGIDVVAPCGYGNMNCYHGDGTLTYRKWKNSIEYYVNDIGSDLLISHYIICRLFRRPFFSSNEGAFLYWMRDRFVRRCYGVDGFKKTLLLTGADNEAVAKGAFQELTRLYGMTMRNLAVAAIGKVVSLPGLGRTDIDVLTRDGVWCESKRVNKTLSLDQKLKLKILKMSLAKDIGLVVNTKSGDIKINKSLLSSSMSISPAAKEFCISNGVEFQENTVYAYRPY